MTAYDEGRRRLAAILAADAAGFSRLMEDNESATVRTLTEYREVFSECVSAHRGRIVDTAGDSVLAIFDSVVEAVNAAVEVQRELASRNNQLPESRRMQFRIGVSLGDIIVREDGTVYGDGVNVAARIESLAEPGGVMLSESAQVQISGKVDLALVQAGRYRVKNIAKPVNVFEVLLDGAKSVTPTARRSLFDVSRFSKLGVGVVAGLAVLVGILIWQASTRVDDPGSNANTVTPTGIGALPAASEVTVAVLPLDNMSGDPEQEYFADGFTDTLITDLSKLWRLSVIARNSTFAYKGRSIDVRDVGKALGATHVIAGAVLQTDGRLRVNVQLIDAASGEHVWADRFDRPYDDIFAVKDEIVGSVISELDIQLAGGEGARLMRRSTESPEAYDLFLKATELMRQMTEANLARAQELSREALALDPDFGAAMYSYALTHYNEAVAGYSESPSSSLDTAEEMFLRAIEMDPFLGPAYGMLGIVNMAKLQHDKALEYAAKAIEVSPGAANSLAFAGIVFIYSEMPRRGLELIDRATQLDPIPQPWLDHPRGTARVFLGDYTGALAHYERCLEAIPDYIWCNVNIIVPYVELGMMDEARAQAREVLRINPDFNTETAVQVLRIKDPQTREHWRGNLRQAGLP